MKKNMGLGDRILRAVAALTVFVLLLTGSLASPWMYILPAIALVFLLTASVGSCPLYTVLGIDTRQFKEADVKK